MLYLQLLYDDPLKLNGSKELKCVAFSSRICRFVLGYDAAGLVPLPLRMKLIINVLNYHEIYVQQ